MAEHGRLIDADALEKDGWMMHRTVQVDNNTMEYQTKKPTDFSTIEPERRWIPVSERLPENGERVLATHLGGVNPDRQVIEHIYENGEFLLGWDIDMNTDSPTFGQRYMEKIIAWMPLPEPYREEGEKW